MKHSRFLCALSLVLVFGSGSSAAQEGVGRITIEKADSLHVTISYDLTGDPAAEYRVLVFLVDENNPLDRVQLRQVRGDVGEGRFAGSRRTITWDRSLEEFQAVEGRSYRIDLSVTRLTPLAQADSEGGIAWYVYAGGAAVVGVAAILLSGGSAGETPAETPKSIPLPPSR